MSVFQTVTPSMQNLDPLKRVNYTFGLVLGVDDFLQEQVYLVEKDRSQYRLAHGYGTVCGLSVRVTGGPPLEVRVAPGVAVNPQGQEIRVRKEMCSRLNDWLAESSHKESLQKLFGAPPFDLSLCVVLCYRECPTDMVPVPGEPCRTQQDAMAASHIAESFELKLCLNQDQLISSPPGSPFIDPAAITDGLCFRPPQVEEDHIREFGALLQRIKVTDSAVDFISQQQLEDMVRQLGTGSPAPSSPPWLGPPLYLHPSDAREFLRAAFLVWVTEVKPILDGQPGSGDCQIPSEQCVLLAELGFSVNSLWQVTGNVTVDERRRPFLVQSRLLQEWQLAGVAESGGGFGPGATVAAGTFHFDGNNAIASGPTYNGLVATFQSAGVYLLNWSGSPAYFNPESASPPTHTYLVNGTAMAKQSSPLSKFPVTFEVLDFRGDGILVRLIDAKGNATAGGFMAEIKEVGMTGL